MARKKAKAPRQWRNLDDHVAALRDNWTAGHFWMMVDGPFVYITHQPPGEAALAKVVISKRHFNRFVDAYNTGKAGK